VAFNFPDSPTAGQIFTDAASGAQYVYTNGVWMQSSAAQFKLGPSFIRQQIKTTTGAITLHADTTAFQVEVVAGGGGGGQIPAVAPAGQASAGTGGAGGAYCSKWIIRPSGTFNPVATIGAGGGSQATGGQSAYGDGTNSLLANGGPGGFQLGAAAGLLWSNANPGQNATGGDFNRNGERGEGAVIHGANQNARSGSGGNSPFGVGGYAIAANAGGGLLVGNAGSGYGAGGSGAIATAGGGGVGGGAGSPGVVVITEYH